MDPAIIEEYRKKSASLSRPSTPSEWKEYNRLLPITEVLNKLDEIKKKFAEAKEIAASSDNDDLTALAKDEISSLSAKKEDLQKQLENEIARIEADPAEHDSRNALIEIRAGAGGEEASLFAGNLFRMYTLFAQKQGWAVEILSQHLSETGGLKEVVAKISGENVFGALKSESGVHRVQRVPVTESSGRIHTSTASVAVMPEATSIDIEVKPEDITVDTYRASGAGGQHVNKTESAIRITHDPTGIIVTCQESRSQLKNREIAMDLLRSRLYDRKLEEEQTKRDNMRKDQIGSAMRAEKIRTYNFPQSRITDHRIKKSWHNLADVMDGNLDDIAQAFTEDTSLPRQNNS